VTDLSPITLTAGEATGSRFSLVSYLPTYAAALFLVLLVAAQGPSGQVTFGGALHRLNGLGAATAVLLAAAILVVAVAAHPLQLPLIRLLEGYWPRWAGPLSRLALRGQRRAFRRLADRAQVTATAPGPQQAGAALAAAWELSRRFPPEESALLPTALGNVLRAAEWTAGAPYGADTVGWWPRLYPVLGDRMREIVDDRRTQLDLACRFSASAAVSGAVSVGILAGDGWWLALALAPFAVAAVAYRSGIAAGLAYGEAVRSAFDLHRFDALAALHLPLPAGPDTEAVFNRGLSRFWLQNVPLAGIRYVHPPAPEPAAGEAKPGAEGRPGPQGAPGPDAAA
jgi:hypothetical protein